MAHGVEWKWVGTGYDCGQPSEWRYYLCPSKKHYVRVPVSCGRRDCERHWRDWLRVESVAIAERVRCHPQARYRRQHVVVSWKDDVLPTTARERSRRLHAVYRILKRVGVRGGAVVVHPARVHTYAEYQESEHEGCNDVHYHVIGIGWINPKLVEREHKRSGVVIVGYGRDKKSAYGRAEYMLSHCVYPVALNPAGNGESKGGQLHAVTYFGELSYASKLRACRGEHTRYCPLCRKSYPIREWNEIEWADRPPDRGDYGVVGDSVYVVSERERAWEYRYLGGGGVFAR